MHVIVMHVKITCTAAWNR